MSERFDLEKWLRAHLTTPIGQVVYATVGFIEFMREAVAAAENHQRELMGCGHPRACWVSAAFFGGIDREAHCTVCAELSHVRQQARAEALEQAAAEFDKRADGAKGIAMMRWAEPLYREMARQIRALESE